MQGREEMYYRPENKEDLEGAREKESQEKEKGEKEEGKGEVQRQLDSHRKENENEVIQAGHSGVKRDQEVAKDHGLPDQKIALCTVGVKNSKNNVVTCAFRPLPSSPCKRQWRPMYWIYLRTQISA